MIPLVSRWVSWFVAVGLALAFLLSLNYCRDRQREQHGAAQQAVDDQKAVVARQDSIVIRDTAKLAKADSALSRTITKWRTRVDTVPVPVHDTVLVATASEVDSIVRACEDYRNICRQTTADFLQLRLDHVALERKYQKLVDTPRPRRRWGLGCAGPVAAVVARGQVYAGPGVGCVLSFSF